METKNTEELLDVRDAIVAHLISIERSMRWLSTKTKIKYPTMYSMLKQKIFNISEDNLSKINSVLNTDFKSPTHEATNQTHQ